jgi:hypothetical protein
LAETFISISKGRSIHSDSSEFQQSDLWTVSDLESQGAAVGGTQEAEPHSHFASLDFRNEKRIRFKNIKKLILSAKGRHRLFPNQAGGTEWLCHSDRQSGTQSSRLPLPP